MKKEKAGFIPAAGNVFIRTDMPKKGPFRIVYSDSRTIYTISTDRKADKELPKAVDFEDFRQALEDGTIVEAEDDFELLCQKLDLSEDELEQTDREWRALKRFWDDPRKKGAFLLKNRRNKVVREIAETLGTSKTTALRKIVRFLKGGCARLSTLGLDRLRATRGPGEGEEKKRRGPKNSNCSFIVTDEDRAKFEEVYKRLVLGEGYPIRRAYQILIGESYCYESRDENGKTELILEDRGHEPTERQFRYEINKFRDRRAEKEAKVGKRKFNNDYSIDSGSQRDGYEVIGPGSCYQIDATNLRINLISDVDGGIISHPLLYLGVDVFSGVYTGMVVTMERESLESTKLLYLAFIESNEERSRRYNRTITDDEMPGHHLPASVLADNGKAKFKNAKTVANDLNMKLLHTRSFCPRDKPIVERAHKVFEDFLEEFYKSVDKKMGKQRGESDPKKYACLTLQELREILMEVAIRHNTSPQENYPLTAEMMADAIEPTPVEIWKWGVRNGLAQLKKPGEGMREYLKTHLLPLVSGKTRKIRDDNVHVNGFFYKPENARDKRIYERHLGEMVPVMYDPLDAGYVYIDLDGETLRLVINDQFNTFKGLPVEDARRLRMISKGTKKGNYHKRLQKKANEAVSDRKKAKRKERERKRDFSPSEAKPAAVRENNKKMRDKERRERREQEAKTPVRKAVKKPSRKKKRKLFDRSLFEDE